MAYSEYLVERIRNRIPPQYEVEEKRMMGGLVFMINGKMSLGVNIDKKSGLDRIMLRVGKEALKKLSQRKGARDMDFTGKPMKDFMFVAPEGFDNEVDLDFWVEKALEFNAELLKR